MTYVDRLLFLCTTDMSLACSTFVFWQELYLGNGKGKSSELSRLGGHLWLSQVVCIRKWIILTGWVKREAVLLPVSLQDTQLVNLTFSLKKSQLNPLLGGTSIFSFYDFFNIAIEKKKKKQQQKKKKRRRKKPTPGRALPLDKEISQKGCVWQSALWGTTHSVFSNKISQSYNIVLITKTWGGNIVQCNKTEEWEGGRSGGLGPSWAFC